MSPETTTAMPRAFHMQGSGNVPSDQNTGYGRLEYHDGQFINPSRNPVRSKGFRALGLNAFVLTTHRQALERFWFFGS